MTITELITSKRLISKLTVTVPVFIFSNHVSSVGLFNTVSMICP